MVVSGHGKIGDKRLFTHTKGLALERKTNQSFYGLKLSSSTSQIVASNCSVKNIRVKNISIPLISRNISVPLIEVR